MLDTNSKKIATENDFLLSVQQEGSTSPENPAPYTGSTYEKNGLEKSSMSPTTRQNISSESNYYNSFSNTNNAPLNP